MTFEYWNLKENNKQLQMQLNSIKPAETTNVAEEKEMYKIFIEDLNGRKEININKNLTINNILANLQ